MLANNNCTSFTITKMDNEWIIRLSLLTSCFTYASGSFVLKNNGPHLSLGGFPASQKQKSQSQSPIARSDQSVLTSVEEPNFVTALEYKVRAAMYCEICQALGWRICVNNHCVSPPTFPRNSVQQTGRVDISGSIESAGTRRGKMASAPLGWRNTALNGNILPISLVDLAAIYCAYCIEKNWQECIEEYCFRRFIIPPTNSNVFNTITQTPVPYKNKYLQNKHGFQRNTMASRTSGRLRMRTLSRQRIPHQMASVPSNPIVTTIAGNRSPLRRLRMRASMNSPRNMPANPTRRQWVGGNSSSKLAQIFCKFCRLLGWTKCIHNYCVSPIVAAPTFARSNRVTRLSFGPSRRFGIPIRKIGFRRRILASRSPRRLRSRKLINFRKRMFQRRINK